MKKLITLILALVMIMTLVACGNNTTEPTKGTEAPTQAPTQAPTEGPTAPTQPPADMCACGCGTPKDQVVWKTVQQWLDETGALTATSIHAYFRQNFHVKMEADFDVTATFGVRKRVLLGQSSKNITANLTLDLNGYTWSSDERFNVEPGCIFTLMDTSAAQTGKMISGGAEDLPGRVIASSGTVNILSGTIAMKTENPAYVVKGGCIYISKGELNIFGGVIENGSVNSDGLGGCIYLNDGDFNMYGGIIRGGQAAQGYNVWMESSVESNLQGGEIVADPADPNNSVYFNG